MGSNAGKFWGFLVESPPGDVIEYFLLLFWLSLETVAKERNSPTSVFGGAKPLAASPQISQIRSLLLKKSIRVGF